MEQGRLSEIPQETKDILAALELSAGKPADEVEREVGAPMDMIASTLQWLTEEQIVQPVPLVDVSTLGMTEYVLYASLMTPEQAVRGKLTDLLVRSNKVQWVGHFDGPFHYGLSVRAKHVSELGDFIDDLLRGMPDTIAQKAFAVRRTVQIYGRRYLSDKPIARPNIQLGAAREHRHLNARLRHLVEDLSDRRAVQDSQFSAGPQPPLATDVVDDNIQVLKEREVIVAEILSVNAKKLGISEFRILVSFPGLHPRLARKMTAFVESEPSVCYLAECLGTIDFELGVEFADASKLSQFQERLQKEFADDGAQVWTLAVDNWLKKSNTTF